MDDLGHGRPNELECGNMSFTGSRELKLIRAGSQNKTLYYVGLGDQSGEGF